MDPCLPTVAARGDCDNTFNSQLECLTSACHAGVEMPLWQEYANRKTLKRIAYTMSKRLDGVRPSHVRHSTRR